MMVKKKRTFVASTMEQEVQFAMPCCHPNLLNISSKRDAPELLVATSGSLTNCIPLSTELSRDMGSALTLLAAELATSPLPFVLGEYFKLC